MGPGKRLRRRFAQVLLRAEAAFWLLLAWVALRVMPFAALVGWLERPVTQPELSGGQRLRTRWSVTAAVNQVGDRFPVPIVCFPRAIAVQAMLRRRGIQTTVYYGAAVRPGKGLVAHVWVQDGPHGVIGQYDAEDYLVLARYPRQDGAISLHTGS